MDLAIPIIEAIGAFFEIDNFLLFGYFKYDKKNQTRRISE
jgi:hypothetical protein